MVLPAIILGALMVGSSAIMVAPYVNEEAKKEQIAKDIVDTPYNDMIEHQSVNLQGTDSLLVANANEIKLPITESSWFIPALFAAGAFIMFLVLRK